MPPAHARLQRSQGRVALDALENGLTVPTARRGKRPRQLCDREAKGANELQIKLEVVLEVLADATHIGNNRNAELETNPTWPSWNGLHCGHGVG
jgi:hypothetical protein